jgi:hypothetical protein
MSLAVAKTSKLALAKGGKFMLPLGGDTLLPPQNIGWTYYSVASDALSLEFYWSAPPGGADYYIFYWSSLPTGELYFETSDQTFTIEDVPLYGEFWSAIFACTRGDETSAWVFKSDIGPSAPYP